MPEICLKITQEGARLVAGHWWSELGGYRGFTVLFYGLLL